MKFSLFLGAGASMPLGFPDTWKFKESLEKSLDPARDQLLLSILQKSRHKDIENILTGIEALMNLPSNQGYNLIKTLKVAYGHMTDKGGPAHKSFGELINALPKYKKRIENHVYKEYSWKKHAEKELGLYAGVFYILEQSDDGVHICTTNYDQAMEHYIDSRGKLIRVDGFFFNDTERKSFFEPLLFHNAQQNNHANSIPCYLYKLHGSLNWIPYDNRIQSRESNENFSGNNFVIYPTLSPKDENYKLDPYFTMFQKFTDRIEKTDFFIIVGYSFRDEHINNMFKRFLRRNNTKMFVLSPSAIKDTVNGLGEDFSYCNIDFCNHARPEWINRYIELCSNRYNGASADPHSSTLKAQLDECFRQLDISYDAKVYNLIGKLEDINMDGAFDMVYFISDITGGNFLDA